ncbi:MAG: TlpA family protein disulfide reductase [Nitrospirae bacterium]|jgi:peroxiredoxin|nr:TlpA family protein disulfide reductase [Nitrospirota bacterium]
MKRILFVLTFLVGFLLPFFSSVQAGRAIAASATDFRLHDVTGRVIGLEDFRGKWVLLNFWATWCGPCLKEIPSLERLGKQVQARLVILGISESLDGKKKLLKFVQDHQMTYPVLIDGLGRVADAYRVHGLPDSVLIDPQGKVTWTVEGAVNWTDPSFQQKFLSGPLKGHS